MLFACTQTDSDPSNMVAPSNGAGAQSRAAVVMDSEDQPKLKGQGRLRKTRFSLRRHLQKHGLAHADSVSSVESTKEGEYTHTCTHTPRHAPGYTPMHPHQPVRTP